MDKGLHGLHRVGMAGISFGRCFAGGGCLLAAGDPFPDLLNIASCQPKDLGTAGRAEHMVDISKMISVSWEMWGDFGSTGCSQGISYKHVHSILNVLSYTSFVIHFPLSICSTGSWLKE